MATCERDSLQDQVDPLEIQQYEAQLKQNPRYSKDEVSHNYMARSVIFKAD